MSRGVRALRRVLLPLALPALAALGAVPGVALAGGAEEAPASWGAGLVLSVNVMRSQPDFHQPTATADHGALHLEGRYNYEAQRTGSLWIGWNLAWEKVVRLTLTPMIGGVFGDVNGFAPSLEWDLTWGPLELQSQNEFLVDVGNWSASDFNYWAEARVWPWEWLRAGVALQRTRAVQTSYAAQWGPALGVKIWKANAAAYWMNPGKGLDEYWIFSFGGSL
jgi:hypothetical protein